MQSWSSYSLLLPRFLVRDLLKPFGFFCGLMTAILIDGVAKICLRAKIFAPGRINIVYTKIYFINRAHKLQKGILWEEYLV